MYSWLTYPMHSPQPDLSVRVLALGDFAASAIPSLNQPQHLKNDRVAYRIFSGGGGGGGGGGFCA